MEKTIFEQMGGRYTQVEIIIFPIYKYPNKKQSQSECGVRAQALSKAKSQGIVYSFADERKVKQLPYRY